MLSREEERELIIAWRERGDQKAFKTLLNEQRRMILSQSKRHINSRVDQDDLMQQAAIGIQRAAERFDMSKDNRFVTYANWYTLDEIASEGRKNSTAVKMPQSHMTGKGKEIWNTWLEEVTRSYDTQENGTIDEIVIRVADRLSVTHDKVRAVVQAWQTGDQSLDAPLPGEDGDRDTPLPSLLIDTETAEETILQTEAEATTISILTSLMGLLDEREKDIIHRRKFKNQTLQEVSVVHKISRERVRQLEERAMGKMMGARGQYEETALNCLEELR